MGIDTALVGGAFGLVGGAVSGAMAAKFRADADVKIAKTNAQQALDEIRELERVTREREERGEASAAADRVREASARLSEAGSALRRAWTHPVSQAQVGEARRRLAAAARLAQEVGRDDLSKEAAVAEGAESKSEVEGALARLDRLIGST